MSDAEKKTKAEDADPLHGVTVVDEVNENQELDLPDEYNEGEVNPVLFETDAENQDSVGPEEGQQDDGIEVEDDLEHGTEAQNESNAEETISKEDDKCDLSEHSDRELKEKGEEMVHPYLYLIETFEYQKNQLKPTTVGKILTPNESEFHFIKSKVGLMKMLQSLRSAQEIAVDMQCTKKDFMGTVCLMEISTMGKDYIIDALKLKNDLLMLTEIFINPKILKIVVCAKTLLWNLQEKLHLYMVNVFDIEKARNHLSEAKSVTLTSIIREECDYNRGQLDNADVRTRPLPEEYKNYYRAGTHYLLYIYHSFKNKLLLKDESLYKTFLEQCREACKVLESSFKERVSTFQAMEEILKNRHKCELEVLKRLFDWRLETAEKRNLQCGVILHKAGMIDIARNLPTKVEEIYTVSNNSVALRESAQELVSWIDELRQKHGIHAKKPKKKRRRGPETNQAPQPQKQASKQTPQLQKQASKQTPQPQKQATNQAPQSQKRKFNNQQMAQPNKQRRLERLIDTPQNKPKNKPNERQFAAHKNKINTFNTFLENKNRKFQFSDNRNSSVFLNPTNVPSSFTFNNSFISPNKSRHEENLMPFSLSSFREDSARRQLNLVDEMSRYQNLSAVDQKINLLERKVQSTSRYDGYSNRPSSNYDGYSNRPSSNYDGYSNRPSNNYDGFSNRQSNDYSDLYRRR